MREKKEIKTVRSQAIKSIKPIKLQMAARRKRGVLRFNYWTARPRLRMSELL